MRSVAFKLAIGFTAVALVGVLIVAYLANRFTTTEFGYYLESGGLAQEQRVADYISERYSSGGGWRGVASVLIPLSGWTGERLLVADDSGRVIADSAGQLTGAPVPSLSPGRSLPLEVEGRTIGRVYLLPDPQAGWGMMGGMMGPMRGGYSSMMDMMRQEAGSPENRFLDAVNRALWIAGGVAVAVALLLGLFISRQITAPLQRITLAARKVARGDFSQRVEIKSKDELASLADTFNLMAESLARNEQQRRQLLSDIAHELKTPLSIVQGNLEAMMDGVVDVTPARLASLREETLLLGRLVTDLRDISLAEAGHLHLHLEPIDLAEVVRTAISGVQAQSEDRRIQLRMEMQEGLPEVSADPDRIGQVLRNLLNNSLRYTPTGGSILVSASSAVSDQRSAVSTQHSALSAVQFVAVSVADTGSGIPPEDLPRIFDRFYRVDKSRARASGGTGLGLSVARQLVEAHRGKIWAESEPGHRTVFHFTLPVAASHSASRNDAPVHQQPEVC